MRCGIICGDPLRKSELLDDLTLVRKLPHGTKRLALRDALVAKGKIAGSGMDLRSTTAIPLPLPCPDDPWAGFLGFVNGSRPPKVTVEGM